MASTINLTDAELRQELKKFGENPGPINANTRTLYTRKLIKLRDSKSSSLDSNPSTTASKTRYSKGSFQKNLHGFSSDESDNEVSKSRKNTSSTNSQRRSTRKTHARVHDQTRKLSENSRPRSAKSVGHKITNGYSDDSDDHDDSKGSWIQVSTAVTNTSPGLISNFSDTVVSKRRSLRNRSSLNNGSDDAEIVTTSKSVENVDMNSDLKDSFLFSSKRHLNSDLNQSTLLAKKDAKNGDLIRRRALTQAVKQNNVKPSDSPETDTSNSTSMHKQDSSKSSPSVPWKYFSLRRPKSFSPTASKSSRRLWPLHCSILIPVCIIGFFVILGLLYITMRSDDAISKQPLLPHSAAENKKENEVSTMNVINSIYELLATTVGYNLCEANNATNIVSISLLKSQIKVDERTFSSALELIKKHVEWNIFLYKDDKRTLLSTKESVANVKYLETTTALLPTLCRLQRAVYKVLYRVGLALLVVLAIWLIILYRNYQRRKNAAERQEMFVMVEKILDVLRKHHESCADGEESFIPIVHVRDMIIPARDRHKKRKIWEMAVHFISANESRIRVETQRVSGEDFRVWRWIQVTTPAKRNQPPKRIWQGTAIMTNHPFNTPDRIPSPCLKIRHMFNPDTELTNDWETQIRDSVLEKCSDNNEIVAIIVEKQSKEGLVYVKCLSCEASGKAFRALHGVWFDGRLVTVKFITLNRFHCRYPATVNLTTPLKKSLPYSVSTFAPQEDLPDGLLTSTPVKGDE